MSNPCSEVMSDITCALGGNKGAGPRLAHRPSFHLPTLRPFRAPHAACWETEPPTDARGMRSGQEVPGMETKSWGLLMLIINIFFPGVGSIIAGLKGALSSRVPAALARLLECPE